MLTYKYTRPNHIAQLELKLASLMGQGDKGVGNLHASKMMWSVGSSILWIDIQVLVKP